MKRALTARDRDRVVVRIRALIRKHGWAIIHDHGTAGAPAISHTVGFTATLGVPEAMVVGIHPKTAEEVLNDLGNHLRSASPDQRSLVDGRLGGVITPPFDLGVRLRGPFAKVGHLDAAAWYYGDATFDVVQVLMPDAQNRLPGFDVDCEPEYVERQRVLDLPSPPLSVHRSRPLPPS